MYYGARYYDPYLSRWIQPDTIVPDPHNPQSLNRFSYGYNNPLKYTDPTGHCNQGADDFDECMWWVATIETVWTNVHVVVCFGGDMAQGCTGWTAKEVALLYRTLNEHLFNDYLDGLIDFIRSPDPRVGDRHVSAKSEFFPDERRTAITIGDNAWYTPPGLNISDWPELKLWELTGVKFAGDDKFQGTVAHELTHAATFFHPELLDRFIEQNNNLLNDNNLFTWPFLRYNFQLGRYYGWDGIDPNDERAIQSEVFAMMVSGLMYDSWYTWYPWPFK